MKTPEEYANELIEKYVKHTKVFYQNEGWKYYTPSAINCAIIDVENTIEAIDEIGISSSSNIFTNKFELINYYQEVLTILKTK